MGRSVITNLHISEKTDVLPVETLCEIQLGRSEVARGAG